MLDATSNSGQKRSALLLDKLMYALQKAIDEQEEVGGSPAPAEPSQRSSGGDLASVSEVSYVTSCITFLSVQ